VTSTVAVVVLLLFATKTRELHPPPYGKWAITYETGALAAFDGSRASSFWKTLLISFEPTVNCAAAVPIEITRNRNNPADFIISIFANFARARKAHGE